MELSQDLHYPERRLEGSPSRFDAGAIGKECGLQSLFQ